MNSGAVGLVFFGERNFACILFWRTELGSLQGVCCQSYVGEDFTLVAI